MPKMPVNPVRPYDLYQSTSKTLDGISPPPTGNLVNMFNLLRIADAIPNGGLVSTYFKKGTKVEVGVEVDLLDLFAITALAFPFFPGISFKLGVNTKVEALKQSMIAIEKFPAFIYPFISTGETTIPYKLGTPVNVANQPFNLLVMSGKSRSIDITFSATAGAEIGKITPGVTDELGIMLSAEIGGKLGAECQYTRLNDQLPEFYSSEKNGELLKNTQLSSTIATFLRYIDKDDLKKEVQAWITFNIEHWHTSAMSDRPEQIGFRKSLTERFVSGVSQKSDTLKELLKKSPKNKELSERLNSLKIGLEEALKSTPLPPPKSNPERTNTEAALNQTNYYINLLNRLNHLESITSKNYRHYLTYFKSLAFTGHFKTGAEAKAEAKFGPIKAAGAEAGAKVEVDGDYKINSYRFQSFNNTNKNSCLVHTQDSWQVFRRLNLSSKANASIAKKIKSAETAKTFNTLTYRSVSMYWKYQPESFGNLISLEMGSGLSYGLSVSVEALKSCTTVKDDLIKSIATQLRITPGTALDFIKNKSKIDTETQMPSHVFLESSFNFKPKLEVKLDLIEEKKDGKKEGIKRLVRSVFSSVKEKVSGVGQEKPDPIYKDVQNAHHSQAIMEFRIELKENLVQGKDSLLSSLRMRVRLSDVNNDTIPRFKIGTSDISFDTPIEGNVEVEKIDEVGHEVMFDYCIRIYQNNPYYGKGLNINNIVPPVIVF